MGMRDYLGEFEQVVLLALSRLDEGAYGASIHQEILDTTGRDVSIPAVYVTLKRLEKKGLVRSFLGRPSGDGSRTTKNYALLPEGERALLRSRRLIERLWAGSSLRARAEGEP